MKEKWSSILVAALAVLPLGAQENTRLTVGGYGEVALTRNFYSDHVYRYTSAAAHAGESHGRFDIPHSVIYLGYDFGRGWSMQTEIEFEHTGTGTAVEKEFEEAGEWESEVEKGGEVELEQFWIQKSFSRALNVRMGHIVVPVGGLNNAHEPLHFFTVYRPEGEFTILPSTWHDTGISLWGRTDHWRYEAQMIAGLDAYLFGRDNFIKNGAGSPFEFKVANQLGFVGRIDHYPIRQLRWGISGFYGRSMHNTFPYEKLSDQYAGVLGRTAVGAFDFAFKGTRLTVRGNADWGYVGDAAVISKLKRNRTANEAPYDKSTVGQNAGAAGLEAGYDILPWFHLRDREQQLYVFGRYEYYNSYIPGPDQADNVPYTGKHRIALGINWFPIPQIAVKAEWSQRFLPAPYHHETSVSIGVAYLAYFRK